MMMEMDVAIGQPRSQMNSTKRLSLEIEIDIKPNEIVEKIMDDTFPLS